MKYVRLLKNTIKHYLDISMRSVKQIKASKRNFAIMYLVGVTIVLERIIKSTRNYAIKGSLTSIKWSIYDAINLLRNTDYEHSFYGPQKDVNYECKQSNQWSNTS